MWISKRLAFHNYERTGSSIFLFLKWQIETDHTVTTNGLAKATSPIGHTSHDAIRELSPLRHQSGISDANQGPDSSPTRQA